MNWFDCVCACREYVESGRSSVQPSASSDDRQLRLRIWERPSVPTILGGERAGPTTPRTYEAALSLLHGKASVRSVMVLCRVTVAE